MRPIIACLALGLLATVSACSGGDKDSFRNVDHDKNGSISYEELLFVFPDVTPEVFDRLDTNGDNVLSENEYAAFLKGDAANTANSGQSPAKSPASTKNQTPSMARPGDTNQAAVPFKGEEVIEIPAPTGDANAKGKQEKGKKDQKAKVEAEKRGPLQYTVARGDNLSRIAHKFGVSVEDITRANGDMKPDTLRDGQVLNIPPRP
jgi:LysM repeat protein